MSEGAAGAPGLVLATQMTTGRRHSQLAPPGPGRGRVGQGAPAGPGRVARRPQAGALTSERSVRQSTNLRGVLRRASAVGSQGSCFPSTAEPRFRCESAAPWSGSHRGIRAPDEQSNLNCSKRRCGRKQRPGTDLGSVGAGPSLRHHKGTAIQRAARANRSATGARDSQW